MSDLAVDLKMLGAFVEDIIMSNVDSTTIVTIKRSGSGLWSIHVSQEPAKPNKFTSGVARARYSTSVLERETTSCFLPRHEIREVPNRKQKPVIKHQSVGSPAQLASE